MNVTSSTAAGNSTAATSSTAASNPLAGLGSDAFLQLMMAELKNQNPLSASSSDPSQFMSQLAQMTAVEQETNAAQAAQQSTALSLLGHTVTYTNKAGKQATGAVQSVDLTASTGPTLTIGGVSGISPTAVGEVS